MKVLMVIDTLSKGGMERRMLELVKALACNVEFEIYLITLTDKVEYEYVYQLPISFEIIKRNSKKDLSLFVKLFKRVNSFKPDIIHSWGSMASIFLAPIAKTKRVKFINGYIGQAPSKVTLRDPYYLRGQLTFPFSDAIVSNTYAGLRAYRTPIKKSYCIYNGIDFKRFENLRPENEIRKELFNSENDESFIVAMVAAFEVRKDYDTFIKVALTLCDKGMPANFLLIGGGQNFDKCKAQIPKSYLNSKIFFLGIRSDIESILQVIDVGVLLTNSKVHGEGISNSIIEYMAAGKPVIATRGGGTDEVVQDSVNGFLVDYKSDIQVIEKIEFLWKNKKACLGLGFEGFKLVHEKFDSINMSKSYTDLYKKILKGI